MLVRGLSRGEAKHLENDSLWNWKELGDGHLLVIKLGQVWSHSKISFPGTESEIAGCRWKVAVFSLAGLREDGG